MDTFYPFVRGLLAWIVTIACLWPLNVPILAFAFRASCGPKPPAMETSEFWTRATVASLAFGLLTLGFVVIDSLLAHGMGFPAGPVHLLILGSLLPVGMWLCFVMFALDDLGQGMTILVMYLMMPIFVLYPVNALFGLWDPLLAWPLEWLKEMK